MNIDGKMVSTAIGTFAGGVGAQQLAGDLTTVTLHAAAGQSNLPPEVAEAWTRILSTAWGVAITIAAALIAKYLHGFLAPATGVGPVPGEHRFPSDDVR